MGVGRLAHAGHARGDLVHVASLDALLRADVVGRRDRRVVRDLLALSVREQIGSASAAPGKGRVRRESTHQERDFDGLAARLGRGCHRLRVVDDDLGRRLAALLGAARLLRARALDRAGLGCVLARRVVARDGGVARVEDGRRVGVVEVRIDYGLEGGGMDRGGRRRPVTPEVLAQDRVVGFADLAALGKQDQTEGTGEMRRRQRIQGGSKAKVRPRAGGVARNQSGAAYKPRDSSSTHDKLELYGEGESQDGQHPLQRVRRVPDAAGRGVASAPDRAGGDGGAHEAKSCEERSCWKRKRDGRIARCSARGRRQGDRDARLLSHVGSVSGGPVFLGTKRRQRSFLSIEELCYARGWARVP